MVSSTLQSPARSAVPPAAVAVVDVVLAAVVVVDVVALEQQLLARVRPVRLHPAERLLQPQLAALLQLRLPARLPMVQLLAALPEARVVAVVVEAVAEVVVDAALQPRRVRNPPRLVWSSLRWTAN